MKIGKGEKVRVRDHRICSDVDGKVNPTWSKIPPMKIGKGEKVRVRDHRICSDVDGKVNPTWSKTR